MVPRPLLCKSGVLGFSFSFLVVPWNTTNVVPLLALGRGASSSCVSGGLEEEEGEEISLIDFLAFALYTVV